MWVTEHRHRLPRETVEFPSLDILGKALFIVLGKWLYEALPEQVVAQGDLQRTLPVSIILWGFPSAHHRWVFLPTTALRQAESRLFFVPRKSAGFPTCMVPLPHARPLSLQSLASHHGIWLEAKPSPLGHKKRTRSSESGSFQLCSVCCPCLNPVTSLGIVCDGTALSALTVAFSPEPLWAHTRQGHCSTLGVLHLGRTLATQGCGSSQWLSQNCGHQWHLWLVLLPSLTPHAGTLCYPKSCWLQGSGMIEAVKTALRAGWWLFSLQGHPWETLISHLLLPSWVFFAFLLLVPEKIKQALCICLLAGHAGGAEEAQGQRSSVATPSTSQG